MTRFMRTVCAVAMLVLFAGTSHGQSSTGSISGVVTDQNQAVIAAATVSIRNTATGFTRSTITTSEGHYSFRDLPIGAYEITFELSLERMRVNVVVKGARRPRFLPSTDAKSIFPCEACSSSFETKGSRGISSCVTHIGLQIFYTCLRPIFANSPAVSCACSYKGLFVQNHLGG